MAPRRPNRRSRPSDWGGARADDRLLREHRHRHDDRRCRGLVHRSRRRRAPSSVRRHRGPRRGRAPTDARAAVSPGDREGARGVYHRPSAPHRRDRTRNDGRAPAVTALALKLVLTPALIAIATLSGRRWGPSIGGWLVGLPFTSGPVSFFLAIEQGTPFAAAAAAGSIGGAAASAVFAIAYAATARRFGWPVSLGGASLAFAVAVTALRAMPLGSGFPLPLLALYAGGVTAAILGIRLIPPP